MLPLMDQDYAKVLLLVDDQYKVSRKPKTSPRSKNSYNLLNLNSWMIFLSGLCLSFNKECATTAPGDCLICLLLSSGLQPGKTVWLQTTNGKWILSGFWSAGGSGGVVSEAFSSLIIYYVLLYSDFSNEKVHVCIKYSTYFCYGSHWSVYSFNHGMLLTKRLNLDIFVFQGFVNRADLGGCHPNWSTKDCFSQREKAQWACALPGESDGRP